MESKRIPTPAPGHVLFMNPGTREHAEEIDKKTAKLPPKEKEKFFKEEMAKMWESVEITAIGSGCTWLEVGDKAIGTPEVVSTAQPTPDGKYLVVREGAFKCKW